MIHTPITSLRVLLVAAALALASVSSVPAAGPDMAQPSPETLQAAKDLVALIAGATIADLQSNMTAKAWPPIEAAVRAQYPRIDDATLAELRGEYVRLVGDAMADAMTDAPAVYARYFTIAEMNEIAAFYRTATGAKALSVMPKAMADMMPTLLSRMQAITGKLSTVFDNILQKHGYQAK